MAALILLTAAPSVLLTPGASPPAARARAATREPREERGLGVRARVESEAVAVEEVPRVVDAEGLDLREDRREHFVVRRPVPRRLRRETERRTRERASASGGDDRG